MNAYANADCCAAGGLALADAQARVLALVSLLPGEMVGLQDVPGRIAAARIAARIDLPGFDRAAMDGYAVRHADLTPGLALPLTGRSQAGFAAAPLCPGGAHRILTGAPIPTGADTVIAQELVTIAGGMIRLGTTPVSGAHIRRRGEDVQTGATLIAAGERLDFRHVALLAAQGIDQVHVRRAPVVALLSSGHELAAPGARLSAGQIHDSNLPMLRALLRGWGAQVISLPPVPDAAAALRAALLAASGVADLVLSTAGISVGDEDHVRDAVRDIGGSLAVLKVAMKPGKPLAAGRIGKAVFIGLPGNPLAALAGAMAFVRPVLSEMCGAPVPTPIAARIGFPLCRPSGRSEFVPVRLEQRGVELWAGRSGPEGSARLRPLLAADGLLCLPAAATVMTPGDMVEVLRWAA